MFVLLKVIKNKFRVALNTRSFGKKMLKSKTRTVYPLALKETINRWYLAAQVSKDSVVKTFGLDRIYNLEITCRNLNPTVILMLLRSSSIPLGSLVMGTTPEKIRLCFSYRLADFIKSFPLHHSQTIVSEKENECIIDLFLSPTYDL
jgi:proteasome accessory factor B